MNIQHIDFILVSLSDISLKIFIKEKTKPFFPLVFETPSSPNVKFSKAETTARMLNRAKAVSL